jgi:hypothetical protein
VAGEAVIFAMYFFTHIAFLWFNVVGPVVVIAVALGITATQRMKPAALVAK